MRRCILVVDDDTMNLRRTKMILEKFYDVVLAESGEAALIVLERHKVDRGWTAWRPLSASKRFPSMSR